MHWKIVFSFAEVHLTKELPLRITMFGQQRKFFRLKALKQPFQIKIQIYTLLFMIVPFVVSQSTGSARFFTS